MKISELKDWQKKKLFIWSIIFITIGTVFLSFVCIVVSQEKKATAIEYDSALVDDQHNLEIKEKLSKNATRVSSGTYVETLKDISFKNSNFRVSFIAWFKWENNDRLDFIKDGVRIYNGVINKQETIKNYSKDNLHYQEMRIDVTVSKNFNIARFPLGSQVLKFYIEPNAYTIDEVVFVPDIENSGINQNLSISGYSLRRHGVSENLMHYPNTMSNPRFENPRVSSEIVTAVEVVRDDWGLYIKCFMALIGTSIWVFMALYICGSHHVNPLGTMPAALFGTIANLMVGANLLPDVVELGLVEFVNIYAALIIIGCIISIINVNRIREHKGESAFSKLFGRVMFYILLTLAIAGHVIMPFSALVGGL